MALPLWIAVALALAGCGEPSGLDHRTREGEPVADVVGLRLSKAEAVLESDNWEPKVVDEVECDGKKPGTVIHQEPAPPDWGVEDEVRLVVATRGRGPCQYDAPVLHETPPPDR